MNGRSILSVTSSFDGLLSVPVEEVGEEDESGHGLEFFGGGACGVTEVLGELVDGHDFEDGMSKDPLPTVGDDRPAGGWNHPLEGVEDAVLSGVDGMDHGRRNSFTGNYLSIECRPVK